MCGTGQTFSYSPPPRTCALSTGTSQHGAFRCIVPVAFIHSVQLPSLFPRWHSHEPAKNRPFIVFSMISQVEEMFAGGHMHLSQLACIFGPDCGDCETRQCPLRERWFVVNRLCKYLEEGSLTARQSVYMLLQYKGISTSDWAVYLQSTNLFYLQQRQQYGSPSLYKYKEAQGTSERFRPLKIIKWRRPFISISFI